MDYLNKIMNTNMESETRSRESEIIRLKDVVQKKLPNFVDQQVIFGVSDQVEIDAIKRHMRHIIQKEGTFLRNYEIDQLVETLVLEITSLGQLSPLMDDPTISEIMINAHDEIWIDRGGKKERTDFVYKNDEEVMELAQRIARNIGRLIDVTHPYVDARLPDGSRVHIIIPPVARKGTTITIRKFFKEKIDIDDLVKFNTITPEMARFLRDLVYARANIMVSGGTGSGKTTTLNVLTNFIPDTERIITIEDSAELQPNNAHIVSMEAKEANAEGRGRVTVQDLVKNALRMFPDRIVIGELRDATAYNFLQAANTGHEGSMATVHANNPDECITRLSSLVMEGGIYKDNQLVRKMVGDTLDIIVQISRMRDRKRRIEFIAEVLVDQNGEVNTHNIFEYKVESVTDDNQVIGEFVRTEHKLSRGLMYKFRQNGIKTHEL
ncbi:CpaF family protein [[Brevibacterium] frigoritolerans]|nr:CpaF family protein [Peribacillus frigoritolerans]